MQLGARPRPSPPLPRSAAPALRRDRGGVAEVAHVVFVGQEVGATLRRRFTRLRHPRRRGPPRLGDGRDDGRRNGSHPHRPRRAGGVLGSYRVRPDGA
ncbi:hypothetical protein ADK58_10590 [Streptomyces sp. XY152]|nr:hypothetical protein ADK58_10590 [Streptomyces sp. XY152]